MHKYVLILIYTLFMVITKAQVQLSSLPYVVDLSSEITILVEGNCNGDPYTFDYDNGSDSFVINNAEGDPANCDPNCAPNQGGDVMNEFETELYDISNLTDVSVTVDWSFTGDLECVPDPNNPFPGCGDDLLQLSYNLDGSNNLFSSQPDICSNSVGDSGTSMELGINGNDLSVTVIGGTQALAETVEIHEITLNGIVSGDDCSMATVIDEGMDEDDGNVGATTSGDEFSSEPPFTGLDCDGDASYWEADIWFEYDHSGGSIIISLAENTAGDPMPGGGFAITILDECPPANSFVYGTCGDWDPEFQDQDIGFCDIPAGTYYIQLSTPFGDEGSFNIEVNSQASPTVAATVEEDSGNTSDDGFVCVGDDFDLLANATGSNISIDWEGPDGMTYLDVSDPLTLMNAQEDPEFEGTWIVTVTDEFDCVVTDMIDIDVNPLPAAVATVVDGEVCEGDDLEFEDTGGDGVSWEWVPPSGPSIVTASNPVTITAISPDHNGTWDLIVTDSEGCTETDMIDVTVIATPANDECDMAEVINSGTAVTSSTTCASNDHDVCTGGGDNTDEQTVWFEFTVGAENADLDIVVTDNGAIDYSILIFDDCPGNGGIVYDDGDADLTDSEDCSPTFGSPHELSCVFAGTTLYIAVGSSAAGAGDFEIEITETSAAPANDECADAETLSEGSNAGLTNVCASDDIDVGSCGATDSEATVWFEYEITGPIIDIAFDVTTVDIVNPTIAVYSGDCGGLILEGEDCGGTLVLLECPPVGTLLIQVGSEIANAGEFELEVTEGADAAVNDLCDDATDEGTLPDDCMIQTVNGDNTNSCPEQANAGGCDLTNDPTVWHQFELPSGTVELQVSNLTAGFEYTLWQDCNTFFGPECFTADTDFTVGPGTYYMSVSSDAGSEGAYSFDLLAVVPPSNDECDEAITLSEGSNGGLTNACATEDIDIGGCGAPQNESSVWYNYEITSPIADITISLTGVDIVGPALAVYDGTAGCVGPLLEDDCGGSEVIITCPPVGELLIHVGSAFDDAGEFEISISEGTDTPSNDICDMATDEGTLPVCEPATISGDNTNACPENFTLAGCSIDTEPTVWHEVEIPGGAVAIEVENVTGDIELTLWDDCPTGGSAISPVCISGDETINIGGGGTYYISVSSPDGSEGPYSFDLTAIVPPDNDECGDAESIPAGTSSGTNVCATIDVILPCQPVNVDAVTVFYEYVVAADVKQVTISIAPAGGSPIMGDIYMGAYTDCGFTLVTADSYTCAGEDLIIPCPEEGSSIFISVGSEADNAGDFDITITEEMPTCTYSNDECDDAEAFDSDPETNMGEVCMDGCNELACPDPEMDAACGGVVYNVVWFQFTTDDFDPAVETFLLANLDDMGNFDGTLQLFDGCGGAAIGPCAGNLNLSNMNEAIDPNTTYWIAVGNNDINQTGGDFELCVELVQGCSNDECEDAIVVEDGNTLNTTLNNCTLNPSDQGLGCGMGQNTFTNWYSYIVPGGVTAFEVEISGATLAVAWTLDINCGDPLPDLLNWDMLFCDSGDEMIQTCVQEGEVYTFIIWGDDPGGDFDITITGFVPDDPENDICDMAIEQSLNDQCEPVTITVDNEMACLENFSVAGGCNVDQDATVWYSVTLPDNATALEFGNFTNALHVSVFEDGCDPLVLIECISFGDGDMFIDGLTGGDTYLIAAGVPQELPDHSFDITAVVPPENDTACPTDPDFPPIDLSGGGTYSGTTCCAIGWNDGMADFQNVECGGASDDNAVWFIYQFSGGSDGIFINASTPGGSWTLEVYEIADPNEACDGNLVFEDNWADCAATEGIEIGCPSTENWYLIKLTSADEDCGDYTLGVQEIDASCDYADICSETSVILNPITNENFEIDYVCASGCLQFACPEEQGTTPGDPCIFGDNPTVWMGFTTDDLAAQLFTTVTTDGSWQPVWSIYGGDDCDNLIQLGGGMGGAPPCSNQDNTPDLHQIAAESDFDMYWVAISADGEVDDPNFEFCVATTINAIICLGEFGQECGEDATIEVTDRENDGPLEGPFCPGEEVTVCIDFFYDATESGADWLIGVVPIFGPAWDIEQFDPNANAPSGSEWYEEGGSCAPLIQEPVPHLCTFTNGDGFLELCNGLCDACPCSLGMDPGDPLPSGWFWVTNGGNAGCDNDCSPGEGWGIGSTTSQINFCMDLIVKEFEDEEECLDAGNLQISFQTFSDGVAGCWEDPVGECLLDFAQFGPVWEVDCNVSPPAVAEPELICSGDPANTEVTIEGGFDGEIFVEIDEDTSPDIEGQSEHEFSGGVGIIDDILENCGTEIDSAKYIVTAIVDGFNCPGPPVVISIPVVPKIQFEVPDIEVCLPFTLELNAFDIVSGGLPPYQFQWFENGTTLIGEDADLSFELTLNTSFILLQVTDDNGCMDEVEIPITVFAELLPVLTIEFPEACPGDPDPVCAIVELGLGVADDYVWTVTNAQGEEVELDINANDEYCIDTEDAPPGIYSICVEVFNDAGCEGKSNVVEFIQHGSPGGILVPQSGMECDDEVVICIDFYGDDPDDDDYNNGPDSNGDGIPDIFDLNDDGIADFQEVVWVTPNGEISTNDLCFTATEEGYYEAYIITDNNCLGDIEGTDVELPAPEPPTIVDPGPQCEGDMFELLAEPNDAANMYVWTETSTMTDLGTANPLMLTATVTSSYQVEMTDAEGCVTTASITVTVNPNPVINLSGALEVCAGLETTLNAGGDAATWTYTWTDVNSMMVVGMTQEVTIPPGDYEVTVVDANNCTSTLPFSVTEEDMITVVIAGEDICDNGTATLDAGVFDTWQWYDPNNNPLGTDQTQVVDMPGTYSVEITVGGCVGSGTYTVNQVDSPTSPVPETASACNVDTGNGPTSLDFNSFTAGGSTGTWDNSANPEIDISDLANVDFQGQAAGSYVFEFTTNTAVLPCVDTTYVLTVTVDDCSCPNPNVQDPLPICSDNDTLDLTTLYLPTTDPGSWAVISGPGTPEIINDSLLVGTGQAAGVYELEYTVDMPGGGNCVNSSIVELIINEPPTMTFDVAPVMCNVINSSIGPSTLDLNSLITSGSGFWQDPMIDDALFNAAAGTIDFDGVIPGVYEIFIITNNADQPCPEATFSIMVEVIDCNCPDTPQFQDPPTLCNDGMPFDLNDLFVGDTFDGTWDIVTQPAGGNLVINADNTVSIGGMVEGDYILMFTLSTDPGPDCPTAFTLQPLEIIDQPTAGNDGFTTLCLGDPEMYILSDLLDGEDNGGTWTDISIDGPSPGSFDALAGTFDASGESAGTYTFQYEIVPDNPCSPVMAIIEVVVEDLPVVEAGQQQMLTCENNLAELGDPSGTVQGAGVTYEWTEMDDPTTVIGTDLEINVSQGGTYVLTVIDQNGCINSDMVVVDAAGNIPTYDAQSEDSPCFGFSEGSITFANPAGGDGNFMYSIDGGQSFSNSPEFTDLGPGVYDLLLVDGDGCEIPDQVTISEPDLLTADAGDDQAIILGTANTLSVTTPGINPNDVVNVVWTDNEGNIVCEGDWDTCNTIEVNADQTTTYSVSVETITGCRANDDIRLNLAVVMDCYVPNIMSVGDDNNGLFFMTCDEFAEAIVEFYIYDRWGNLVFSIDEPIEPNIPTLGWDGKFNGQDVEQGVYVYLIKVKFIDVEDLEVYAGDLTVIR